MAPKSTQRWVETTAQSFESEQTGFGTLQATTTSGTTTSDDPWHHIDVQWEVVLGDFAKRFNCSIKLPREATDEEIERATQYAMKIATYMREHGVEPA